MADTAGALPFGSYPTPDLLAGDKPKPAFVSDQFETREGAAAVAEELTAEQKAAALKKRRQEQMARARAARKAKRNGDTELQASAGVPDEAAGAEVRPPARRGGKGRRMGVRVPDAEGVPAPRKPARRGNDQAEAASADPPGLGYYLDPAWYEAADINQAQSEWVRLTKHTETLGKIISSRHDILNENKCDFCSKVFGNGEHHYGRRSFELQPGVYRTVQTCRNANCVQKYNEATYRIARELRIA